MVTLATECGGSLGVTYPVVPGQLCACEFFALALINDPEIVFLDELTTGLDPQARRAIWELVRGIRDRGKTVFLTTHLMEEAERLCDRVAIIEHGRIIDIDSSTRDGAWSERHCLSEQHSGHRTTFDG